MIYTLKEIRNILAAAGVTNPYKYIPRKVGCCTTPGDFIELYKPAHENFDICIHEEEKTAAITLDDEGRLELIEMLQNVDL